MTRIAVRVCGAVCLSGLLLTARTSSSPAAQQGPPDSPTPAPPSAGSTDRDPPAGQQVFRTAADAVLVDVYPHRDGRIVEGLTADQFELFEDGDPQRIASFEFVRLEGGPGENVRRDPASLRGMREQAADPHNRVFVVYLDKGHTTVEGGNLIRRPLVDMLDRAVGPQDLFGVMLPGMRPTDVTLGRRTLTIENQLGQYWSWGQRQRLTDDPADPMEAQLTRCFETRYKPGSPPNQDVAEGTEPWLLEDGIARRTFDTILIDRRREDRALGSLEDLVTYLAGLREARSVVVIVSDGWQLFPRAPHLEAEPARDARFYRAFPRPGGRLVSTPASPRPGDPRESSSSDEFKACVEELNRLVSTDGERRLRDLIQHANRSNVSFYPVASAGLQAFDSHVATRSVPADGIRETELMMRDMTRMTNRTNTLRTIAEATDGIAVVDTNDYTGGMRRIVEDVSAYYLLTYVSTNDRLDGRFRRIEVRVQAPDLSVRARRGYTAARPIPAGPAAPRPGRRRSPPGSRRRSARSSASAIRRGRSRTAPSPAPRCMSPSSCLAGRARRPGPRAPR